MDGFLVLALRFIGLLGLWLLLSGRFDLLHVSLGVISAAVVAVEAKTDVLPHDKIPLLLFLRRGFRLVVYLFWLALEILKANFYVLTLVFSSRMKSVINPSIVKFSTSLEGEFARYVFATSITLTPGTVTVRIIGDELVVHAISDKAAEGLTDVMQKKIAWVFE